MRTFYKSKVKNIIKETEDSILLEINISKEYHSLFEYMQGQYLTFKKTINGVDVRRSYSLCSSPLDKKWEVVIKQVPQGIFSTYANTQLKIGDEIEVMKPAGNFYTEVDSKQAKNYIAFAAGSGITPILSIIKTHLKLEPESTFKLFYLNSKVKHIILKEEIEQLKNRFFERFQVFHFLTKEHRDIHFLNGRFDIEKLNILTNMFIDVKNTNNCFICGPQEMVFLIKDYFEKSGLKKENIHYELFFTGDQNNNKRASEIIEQKKEGANITILNEGKESHFIMGKECDNILDSALDKGLDLSFACKSGVCSTCKCRVIEGSVKMKINYALDEKEVSQNLILSCQAVPLSKKVVIDFDI